MVVHVREYPCREQRSGGSHFSTTTRQGWTLPTNARREVHMTQSGHSATAWVAQSPERIARIYLRANGLVTHTQEEHFRRLILQWAQADDGPLPTRAQALSAAHAEIETLCRGLGRLAALTPDEIFPCPLPVTTPHSDGGW